MSRIAIVSVPFFVTERLFLWAKDTMRSVQTSHALDTIAIINQALADRTDQDWLSKTFKYVEHNDVNILARAWNKGIIRARERGAEYVLIMNLDGIFHPQCIDNLVAYGEANPEALVWSATAWNDPATLERARLKDTTGSCTDWSCFMLRPALLEKIGPFDEQFAPAYQEDNDMRYRLKLAGYPEINLYNSYFCHYDQGTVKGLLAVPLVQLRENVERVKQVREFVTANDQRYIAKWGGGPRREQFIMPYGREPGN